MIKFLKDQMPFYLIPSKDFYPLRIKKVNPSVIPSDVMSDIEDTETLAAISDALGFMPVKGEVVQLSSDDIIYLAKTTKSTEGTDITFFEVTICQEGCKNCHISWPNFTPFSGMKFFAKVE